MPLGLTDAPPTLQSGLAFAVWHEAIMPAGRAIIIRAFGGNCPVTDVERGIHAQTQFGLRLADRRKQTILAFLQRIQRKTPRQKAEVMTAMDTGAIIEIDSMTAEIAFEQPQIMISKSGK